MYKVIGVAYNMFIPRDQDNVKFRLRERLRLVQSWRSDLQQADSTLRTAKLLGWIHLWRRLSQKKRNKSWTRIGLISVINLSFQYCNYNLT